MAFQEVASKTKVMEKIQSIYALTARQAKMDEKHMKMKQSTSRHGTGIPQRKHWHIRPDWNLRRNSIREIDDPLQAISFVMQTLQLPTK